MTGPSEPDDQATKPAEPAPFEPMPSAPAPSEAQFVATARPKTVDRAFIAWLVFAVLLLGIAVLFLATDDATLEDGVRTAFEQQNRSFTENDVSQAAAFIKAAGIGFNVLFAILVAACAFAMRAGRNWARITLCVLGGVVVVAGFLGLGGGLLFILVQLVVIVLGVVFMFRRDSAPYFAPNRAGTR